MITVKNAFILLMVLAVTLIAQPLSAVIRLPRLVSDKMVLQRDTELKIWGWRIPVRRSLYVFKASIMIRRRIRKVNGR
ncbi:hypothetical protein SAMN05192582_100466 [Bacteroides ovatus]|uniref:Uncharacterized protein n=1 Tax=Bacteroides ovatus TaxID=28116 RepID=A0A1G8BJA5_BACOV|nr:hypothetical protein SAMN05192582_100466 [Bacteroides ovatus]